MRFRQVLRVVVGTAAIAALVSGAAPSAHALQHVNSCTFNCTENCQLDAPLRCCADQFLCDGAGPIKLYNGADLDMNGQTLHCFCGTKTCNGGPNNNALCTTDSECPSATCTDGTDCTTCGSAVTVMSSGSLVKDLDNDHEAFITGPFSPAVSCGGNLTSRVQKITFTGIAGTVLSNCAQVDQNVFFGGDSSATAVSTSGVATSDFIKDNYFDDWVTAISVSGNKPVDVNHNLVSLRHSDGTGVAGIDVHTATSTTLRVEDNIVQGTSSPAILHNTSVNAIFNRNYCHPLNTSVKCSAVPQPFVMP